MTKLVVKSPQFFSPEDERHFFGWLEAISGVHGVVGVGMELHISCRGVLSEASLREMLALFQRYCLPMTELRVFANERNRRWFEDQPSYWQQAVFGHAASGA